MGKRYRVTLDAPEREELDRLLGKGKADVRRLKHAQILLKADEAEGGPAWPDARIAEAVGCGTATVERVRRRFIEEGLELALSPYRTPRREYRTKLDGEQEAKLIATACSAPPQGRARWTLRLLADRLVELGVVESIGHETVRQALKKTSSSRT
jgi:transposase